MIKKEKRNKKKTVEYVRVNKDTVENEGSNEIVNNPSENKKSKKGVKKAVIIVGAALIIAVGGCFAMTKLAPGLSSNSTGMPVNAAIVEKGDIRRIVTVRGIVEGADSADVFSTANYRISSITVKEGDKVTKGQILAKLDASELTDQYSIALISAQEAKAEAERAKILYEEGAISRVEYDAAVNKSKSEDLRLSTYNLSEKANVTSPIDGTITRVNCTVGRIAGDTGNNTPMFVIENIDSLKMKVDISEKNIGNIEIGQTVEITADVLGKDIATGTVTSISPTGEKKSDSTEMIIPVTITIDKNPKLFAGVTAKAKILTGERKDVLTVPIDAIFDDPNTDIKTIFVIDEGVLSQREVKLGLEEDLYVEILNDDIKEGDQILLSPSFEHQDGMTVSVIAQQ